MAKPRIKIRSVIVASDIRQEINGQQTIVGAYFGFLGSTVIPLALPQLVFRIEFESDIDASATCEFAVVTPSGARLMQQSNTTKVTKFPFNLFVAGAAPIVFREAGKYQILFGVGTKAKTIDTFEIKLGLPPPPAAVSAAVVATPPSKPPKSPKPPML
jgi:hypothetical protein